MSAPATTVVRISTDILGLARETGETSGRTAAGQLEHWATLGRLFEAMPTTTVARARKLVEGELDPSEITDSLRVRDALLGVLPVDELDEDEQEIYYDLEPFMGPSEKAKKFFAELRERGGGVGLDEKGRMVRGLPGGGVEPYAARPAKVRTPGRVVHR